MQYAVEFCFVSSETDIDERHLLLPIFTCFSHSDLAYLWRGCLFEASTVGLVFVVKDKYHYLYLLQSFPFSSVLTSFITGNTLSPLFPVMLDMLINPPLHLHPNRFLLTLPNRPGTSHPLAKKLHLLAVHLSGNPLKPLAYQQNLEFGGQYFFPFRTINCPNYGPFNKFEFFK